MKRYLAFLFGVAGLSACTRQPPPHTADDSSWVRPVAAEPAAKAAELEQVLSETPNPWEPPKASEAVAPTTMNKPPPATEPPAATPPVPPNAAPQPDPL